MAWGAVEDEGRVGRELSFGDGGGVEGNEGRNGNGSEKDSEKRLKGEEMKGLQGNLWAGTFDTYP